MTAKRPGRATPSLASAIGVAVVAAALGVIGPDPAFAQDSSDFDLARWAMALDPDTPASGGYLVYDGGPGIEGDHAATLRSSLYADDPLLPLVAVEELAAFGVPEGEAMLLEIARSERWAGLDPDLQREIVRALRTMRSGRALPVLARIAFQGEGPAEREAIRGLCESLAPEADDVLRALVADGDRRKQKLVIRWLRKTGERESARVAKQVRREDRRDDRVERKDDRRERRDERKEDREERREERRERRIAN